MIVGQCGNIRERYGASSEIDAGLPDRIVAGVTNNAGNYIHNSCHYQMLRAKQQGRLPPGSGSLREIMRETY